MPLRAFDLLALDAPVIDKEDVPDGEIDVKQRATRSGPSAGCGRPAKHLALRNRAIVCKNYAYGSGIRLLCSHRS